MQWDRTAVREPDMQDEAEVETVRRINLFGREIAMPRSRMTRIVLGCLLIFGGLFGFLPILGFWMLPLGLLVLSYEYAWVRRHRRRFNVWWGNRRGRRRRKP